ncbi:ABC transporter permease [Halobacteria archaeon AArc-curdl1]|uniref:ABC transporter permease n=1 Tax=Natronosalvus hydrolyticus TaxID=2979988 RepID=A0AAP2ZBF9_9EURY|nr:ABC transporter permease [Halobacteria archaeon AArc-curdl1]
MRPLESLRLSWRSIRGHRLRSALTTLGVIIGIAAVIAFVSLGASLQAGIIGDISPDDQRNLYGWAADPDTEGGPLAGAQFVFSQNDLDNVSELEPVEAAYGYATIDAQSITYGGETRLQGDGLIAAGPSYIREGSLKEGRQFQMGEREAVINPAAAEQFDENVSVGDELEVTIVTGGTETLTVVGITDSSEGQSPFEGFEAAPRIYVPTDPFYVDQAVGPAAGNGDTDVDNGDRDVRFIAIVVEAPSADQDDVDRTRDAAIAYFESDQSDASEFLGDDLAVILQTSTELLQQLEDILGLLQNFIVGIAAISLVVGSIGIANIMLVSVTERTREIGIMKAVGAQNRDILTLFLSEAVILGVVGAVLGTALGLAVGYLGAWYIDLPLVYPFEYVVLAIAAGIGVGVISGLYPAWRAARTDPIDALRYE